MSNPFSLCAQNEKNLNQDDSVIVNKKKFPFKEVIIPATTITYGILSLESPAIQNLDYSTRNEITEDKALFYNKLDNYMQFSPGIAAFGLKAIGIQSKHNWSDMLILYGLSNLLETTAIYTAKYYTPRKRPDNSNGWSFPSGHTATAFVAAEFLHQEYKNKSIWISVGGYGMATLIGASRVFNNKHWISDVVTGAGIGILSTKIVYWSYPYLQNIFRKNEGNKVQTVFFPSYNEGLNLTIAHKF